MNTSVIFAENFPVYLRFIEDGEIKYLGPCKELEKMERNCLEVSFDNVEEYNQELSTVIIEEFYR